MSLSVESSPARAAGAAPLSAVAGTEGAGSEAASGDSIKVLLRVRPLNQRELDNGGSQLCLQTDLRNNTVTVLSGRPETMTFDHVADATTTQEEIFRAVGKVVTDNCLQGYNATVFAYGQTGAGKTFTMHGPAAVDGISSEQRGLIPRIFEYLFARISREQKKSNDRVQYLCSCSNIEIYQDSVYDLLEPMPTQRHLREDIKRGVFVDGAIEETITSPEEAYRILQRGAENRRVAETAMNHESSRSHSVFILYIRSKTKEGSQTITKESRFNLVDLAGSERQRDTHAENLQIKEAGKINKSLHVLGSVINALVDQSNGQKRYIHYRDSKLTFLLRDSLGGNARTYIIANVSPSVLCLSETSSTLRFARSAKLIRNLAQINEDTIADVGPLIEENNQLKRQLQALLQGGVVPAAAAGPSAAGNDELIVGLIERNREGDEKLKRLEEQLRLAQKLNAQHQQQLQSNKMVIKLRDSTITHLKQQQFDRESFLAVDKENKDAEQRERQRMHEQNADVTKFAAENLQLREQLAELQLRLGELQAQPSELVAARERERRLEDIVLSLSRDNAALKAAAACDRTGELLQEVERLTQQVAAARQQAALELQTMAHAMQAQTAEFAQLKFEKADLAAEVDSLNKQRKDLETALETRRQGQELEIKRLSAVIETLRDDHVKASSDVSSVSAQLASVSTELAAAQTEAMRARQACDEKDGEIARLQDKLDKLEQKTRRMSNFASESKAATQETLRMLNERVTAAAAEKDRAEAVAAELQQKLAERGREVETQRAQRVQTEGVAAALLREKGELEEEVLRNETDMRKKSEQVDKLTEQLQSVQSEIMSLQDELAFHTQQAVRDEKEMAQLRTQASQQEQQAQHFKAHAEQLAAQVELLMAQGDSKYNEAATLANELRSELALLQDQRDQMESSLATLQTANAAMQQQRAQHERELAANQQTIKELMAKLQESRERVIAVEDVRAELAHAVGQLQTATSALTEKEALVAHTQGELQTALVQAAQLRGQLAEAAKAHAADLEQALGAQGEAEAELARMRAERDQLEHEREEHRRHEEQASQQQSELMSSLRKSVGGAGGASKSGGCDTQATVAALQKELEAQLMRSAQLEEQQAQLRKEKDDEARLHRSQQAAVAGLERQLAELKVAMIETRATAIAEARLEMNAQLESADMRLQQLEERMSALAAEKRRVETEAKQQLFRLKTAEEELQSLVEDAKRASELEEQANRRAEEAETQLRQLKEEYKSVFGERDKLRSENEKLSHSKNDRQRIQHLLEVKRENNALRDVIQDLQRNVTRLERELGSKRAGAPTTGPLAAGSENRPLQH